MRTRVSRWSPAFLPVLAAIAAISMVGSSAAQDDSYEEMPGETRSGAIPGDTTITNGKVPKEIVGRWVAILDAKPLVTDDQKGAGGAAVIRTFEITEVDDALVVNLHRGQLPDAVKERLDPRSVTKKGQATAAPKAATAPPDASTLAEIAKAWPGLLAPDERVVASRVIAYDMVSDEDKAKLGEPGTRFFVLMDEGFKKSDSKPMQSVTTMSVRDIGKDKFSGKTLQAIVLPGQHRGDFSFPPVPVALGGDFVAYRVPDASGGASAAAPVAEKKGFAERILGMFSGCGS